MKKFLLVALLGSTPLFAVASVNVTVSYLDILESPSPMAPVLGQLKAGDKVLVENCTEDFCKILVGESGYATAFVSKQGLIPQPAPQTAQVESTPESEETESSETEEYISEDEIGVGGALLIILGLILVAIVGSWLLKIWSRFSGDRPIY